MHSKIFIVLALLISTEIVNATGHLGSDTKVEKIRMSKEDRAIVYTSGQLRKASCATTSGGFILELPAGDLGNRYYSTLLTALVAGKTVNMWCPDLCESAYGKNFTFCQEISIE